MTLIASISGVRGTIGGKATENLTPLDIVKFSAAYGQYLSSRTDNKKIVLGRDARISGKMVNALVSNTLVAMGFSIVDLGITTTPTVEIAVPEENAAGGIILTASHNPKHWNALKLLNEKGEFISGEDGEAILGFYSSESFHFSEVDELGTIENNESYLQKHIEHILNLEMLDLELIKNSKLKVVVDGINSSGAVYIPALLNALGITDIVVLNEELNGDFAHNPEPLKENLTQISEAVIKNNADLGIVVDPDVDRLAFIMENGEMFGEEYTLVAVADYILSKKKGAVVSNLSSSRALRDIAKKHDCEYFASAVGEVNVVKTMKANTAVIGGEGNGGVIYPDSHYGRDALVGVALFLSHFLAKGLKMTELRAIYPRYQMVKDKVQLDKSTNVDGILKAVESHFSNEQVSTIDGVKVDFQNSWVHIRKSNTEPIIRIYTEAPTKSEAEALVNQVKELVHSL